MPSTAIDKLSRVRRGLAGSTPEMQERSTVARVSPTRARVEPTSRIPISKAPADQTDQT
jgi:hypothetical protein